ncbi:GIP [Symbiodinium natans]|uniref:GIP protein n=1 Tax=Symbiodinium natans TaxID=878477 RepID=A0A812QXQ8_9DINO|nr:GIP [Symbiodinium natans]
MRYDMSDYCANACRLYEDLSKRPLKPASTPFVPDGSILASDWESKGALASEASRVLMKTLWLARLSRPDLMKGISDLTRRITRWSVADDKKLHRLMSYLKGTPNLSVVHKMGDAFEDLRLSLYTDADHSGDVDHAQSTSGMILCLEGENTYWPLAWSSKKQTATSRILVFGEALPAQEFLETLTGKEAKLVCHQDNSAVIQIVHAGYSPKLRHVSKTHRVNLSSLYEVFESDPLIRLQCINTELQEADVFTKALPPAKFPAALKLLRMVAWAPLGEAFDDYGGLQSVRVT